MKVQYRYEPFQLKDILSEKTIKIPKFQRNVVWNNKKRKEFVDTLRNGNPFGSILVHQNENKEYSLVDGLQRISTIKNYYKNPYDYFDYSDVSADLVKQLLKYYYNNNGYQFDAESDAISQNVIAIQKSIFSRLKNGDDAIRIGFGLSDEFSLVKDEKTFSIISDIIKVFKDSMDISDLLVPAIVYTGSSENLPTIFYNLNTGGVNLSKYETFSSLWDDTLYKIYDKEIINKIYEKYDVMREKSELEVDISKDDIEENGITLFEYCYSISEILRDKNKEFNLIFGTNKKSTDPIGFEILSLILGLDVNKAERLGLKEVSGRKGVLVGAPSEFLVRLKNIIVESFSKILESLKYWICAENNSYNTLDSTYMLYHMAYSYINHNYNIDYINYKIDNIGNKLWNDKFLKYLPLHYLKDYITDFWKINRQVSDLTRELNNNSSLNKYANNISMEEWNGAFNLFRNNQMNDNGKTISLKSKLFLDYLVKLKFSQNAELKKYFTTGFGGNCIIDYEHIIPQKRIENKIGNTKSFPVSSLGNLCYLASKDNRSKREKTLYEFIDDRPSFASNPQYLELINYPSQEELRFIDYQPFEFDSCYRKFISDRMDVMFEQFKKLVHDKFN